MATLFYTLPFAANPGDVVLLEPGPIPQQITDVLRSDVHRSLFFFSERETTDVPPFDPADVAQLPQPNVAFPTLFVQVVGRDGINGAVYVQNPADPGYENGIVGLTYNFISDVPEPGIPALALL